MVIVPPITVATGVPALPSLNSTVLARWHADGGLNGTADGAALGTWTDLINGYNLVQSTGAAQPTLAANVQNGRRGVLFSGAQFMQMASVVTAMMPQNMGMYIIVKPSNFAPASAQRIISAYDGTAHTGWRLGLDNSPRWVFTNYDGTQSWDTPNSTLATTAAHLVTLSLNQGIANKQQIIIDGTGQNNAANGQAANTTVPFGIGADLFGTISNYFTGHILEIVLTSVVGTGDQTAMHNYSQNASNWATP
jgi:hypothetical protein